MLSRNKITLKMNNFNRQIDFYCFALHFIIQKMYGMNDGFGGPMEGSMGGPMGGPGHMVGPGPMGGHGHMGGRGHMGGPGMNAEMRR